MQKMSGGDVSNGGSIESRNNNDIMETVLDVQDDDNMVKTVAGDDVKNSKITSLASAMSILQVSGNHKSVTTFTRVLRAKTAATNALKGLKFIGKIEGAAGWEALEKRFNEITKKTNPVGLLPRSRFGECLGMNKDSKEFAGELLDALIRRQNMTSIDLISKEQLKKFWDEINDQSFSSRLRIFFAMVDKDGNGQISENEVREMIISSASANKLSNIRAQAGEYAKLIMEELDPDNRGYIDIESLKTLFLQLPAHSVEGENLSKVFSQSPRNVDDTNIVQQKYNRLKYFLQDNWQRVWVIVLWIVVMAVLFTWKYIQYKNRSVFEVMGHCVCVAKGAAETLKLNMALILFPVCRNTITWLRNKTKLGVVVPFDDNLNFHKVIALGITIGVGLHVISHLACDFPRLLSATKEEYEPLKQFFGEQPESYVWFVKGVEGWTGIVMVILMTIVFTLATPRFRRGRINLPKPLLKFVGLKDLPKPLKKIIGFNTFWYTHHLLIIVYALFIVHGIKLYLTNKWYKKTTWMYLAIPILLYAGERLTRALRTSIHPVEIIQAVEHPGDVLALHMSKPKGFKYKSGQYVFVNCSAVSPFEWHPFSITSAPGDDYLGVHIRALGDWTRKLHKVFSKVSQTQANGNPGDNQKSYPKVQIDGPYAAPSQDYQKYDVVLIVGLGIGGTPIISIIRDIINNMKAKKEEYDSLETGSNYIMSPTSPAPLTNKNTSSNFKATRAYSYWVTREQGTFDWFKGVMNEVAEIDHDGVIEMHNYCTSVYEQDDARSALITMLQSLKYTKTGVDIVSGTRVKSHFAKPDWRSVYKHIQSLHPNQRVGVFYCGSAALVKELKQLAYEFSHESSTKFDFHKENF